MKHVGNTISCYSRFSNYYGNFTYCFLLLKTQNLPVISPSCLRAGGLPGFPRNWWWTRVTLGVLRLSSGCPESTRD
ncbi:hypothetical protein HanIR_Chr09g0417021 [Helianthus annuus]|nr:hypothetical protein HanIR_Chr09g0417021 [Helianthus annuus]